MTGRQVPAIFIVAPASGQGKTTVTAALARYHRNCGRRVRVFKTGPDFIDPQILEIASGERVCQLDLWMGSEAYCRHLLYRAAEDADLIIIEGVMGLFDGEPSSADLAKLFAIPVVAVIDAKAMAQTFAAIVYGLAHYDPELNLIGVVANRVGSQGHIDILRGCLPPEVAFYGSVARDSEIVIPSRHLGLVQAGEIEDLDHRLDRAAEAITQGCGLDLELMPAAVTFHAQPLPACQPLLAGVTIAVARDAAFSFLYHANLDLLQELGATLSFFSPLMDALIPEADSLYLPGGYPELHLQQLAANHTMLESVRAHHRAGRPIVAECGGMLYLMQLLADKQGACAEMVGLIPGTAQLQPRLMGLGFHTAPLPEGEIRGHSYHHSTIETTLIPIAHTRPRRSGAKAESILRSGRLHASYIHLYLPSNPEAGAKLFQP